MALKVKLAKLEDAAESERPFYKKQEDGTFLLETEGEPEAGALKSTLQKERKERAALQRQLDAIGKTPEEITELEDRLAELDAANAGKEPVDKQIAKAVEKATKPLQTKLDAAESTVKEQQAFIDNTVREKAAQEVFAELGDWELLKPHVLPQLKAVRTEGAEGPEWSVGVVDAKGVDRDGFTIAKLADEMQASGKYSRAFNGTGASGSGALPAAGARAKAPVAASSGSATATKRGPEYNAL